MEIVKKQVPPNGLLNEFIDSLMEERLFGIAYQKTAETTEYVKTEKRLASLSNNIRDRLGYEQNLFMQYEELSTLDENALLRDAYKQGVIDGVGLLREICLKV